jgi:membrane-associated phospholipid phosphatase
MTSGIYLTWITMALAGGVILIPLFKPPWAKVNLRAFNDMFRRYWLHILLVFSIYFWKDTFDSLDRIFMANTQLEMTGFVYALEGDMVLWVQQFFEAEWLTISLTHLYVSGYLMVVYISIIYFCYFNDRHMADRISLTVFFIYALSVPFYLFFNVRVTGAHIPAMETLAYDLTPEINDWFERIDPFTNGMPSLHIGIPFGVWLCLVRWDEDNRWMKYRRFIFGYIVLTAFTIVYLGIHWFVDIIGGMFVAAVAIKLTQRYNTAVWAVLDERTLNIRLATIVTRPQRVKWWITTRSQRLWKSLRHPSSQVTGLTIIMVFLLTTSVIVWDMTHRDLPVTGVQAPAEAVAADGWLINIDDRGDEGIVLVVVDLATPDEPQVINHPVLTLNSSYDVAGNLVVVSNQTELWVQDLSNLAAEPMVIEVNSPSFVKLAETGLGESIVVLVESGNLRGITSEGNSIIMPTSPISATKIVNIAVDENKLAIIYDDNATLARLGQVGVHGFVDFWLNSTAAPEEDATLASWGYVVDIENATVVDLEIDGQWLVATINVTATDRLILLDTETGESRLLADPKYPAHDPSIGHGIVVWASQWHLNPIQPSAQFADHEIWYYDLSKNLTEHLTEDLIDQRNPQVSEDHIVWQVVEDGKVISTKVHRRDVELQPYSSIALQLATLILIPLICFHIWKGNREAFEKASSSDSKHSHQSNVSA